MKKLDDAQFNWNSSLDTDRPGKIDLSEWQAASAQLESNKPSDPTNQGVPKPNCDPGRPTGERKI